MSSLRYFEAPTRPANKRKCDKSVQNGDSPVKMKPEMFQSIPLGDITTKDEEEKMLDMLVFGADEGSFPGGFQGSSAHSISGEIIVNESNLSGQEGTDDGDSRKTERSELKPAWYDEDDNESCILSANISKSFDSSLSSNRKAVFKQCYQTPAWAEPRSSGEHKNSADNGDDDDDPIKFASNYIGRSASLPKTILQFKRLRNANYERLCSGRLTAVEFHPYAQVMLAAGTDCSLSLFQVDGKKNPVIQTVSLEGFQIGAAHFTANGKEVILTANRRYFYVYDMIAGKISRIPGHKSTGFSALRNFDVSPDGALLAFPKPGGYVHLYSAGTKEWIDSLKVGGEIEDIAFTSDGTRLLSTGDGLGCGAVHVWDMRATRRSVHRFHDNGAVRGTAIATCGPSGESSTQAKDTSALIACGSQSGFVNIYAEQDCLTQANPAPLHTRPLGNLNTAVTTLRFNKNSELLFMASRFQERAARLVHTRSSTVFSNFPERTDPLRMPQTAAFSPGSGYLSIASKGNAHLYRLSHYGSF